MTDKPLSLGHKLLLGLLFGLAGFALNWIKLDLFFNVNFVFGSIATMVAVRRFGLLTGLTAALIASSATIFYWTHPWAVLTFTAEALVVHQLGKRRQFSMLVADIFYWFTIGLLLIWLAHHQIMGFAPMATMVIALKQGINGIFNTLLAQGICLLPWMVRRDEHHEKPTLRELLFVGLAALVLIPTLAYTYISINSEFKQRLSLLEEGVSKFALGAPRSAVDLWFSRNKHYVEGLAAVLTNREAALSINTQLTLEKLCAGDDNISRLVVVDHKSITRAFVPRDDGSGHATVGLDLSDRPFIKEVMVPPFETRVVFFMGKIISPGPRLAVVAPIHEQGQYKGAVLSVYGLEKLQALLQPLADMRDVTATIIDPQRRVVVSSNKAMQPFNPFVLPRNGNLKPLNGDVFQWIPDPQPGIGNMKRWLRSFYYMETSIPGMPQWKMVVECPLKPLLLETNQQTTRSLCVIALILLLALLLAHTCSRYLAQVFVRLEEFSRGLADRILKGDAITWPAAAIQELEGLTTNFQNMAASLQQQSHELQALNEDLEERVEERTSQLEEAESRQRALINLIPDIVCLKDGEGRWLIANNFCLQLFELTEIAYQGKTDKDLAPFSPFCFDAFMDCYQSDEDVWKTGEQVRSEVKISLRDGSSTTFDIIKLPVFRLDGSRKSLLVVGRDITKRKQIEKELQETAEAKMQFLANMSHEIRTPMNGVIGMAGLLQESGLNSEQQQYAEVIRASGDLLLTIVNDILDFSKIEAHRLDLESMPFAPLLLINELVTMITPQVQDKGLKLVRNFELQESTCLIGDMSRLRQILFNLVGNAIKFTETGAITIRSWLVTDDSRQVVLHFQVRDTGIGIPKDRLASLFDPFTQADSSTTRKYGGTGLGLAISRQLAQLMGGEINAISLPGQGSSFTVAIPFKLADEETACQFCRQSQVTVEDQVITSRVLVVEDNLINQLVARTVLEKQGHKVTLVANGKEALEMLRLMSFDLVLMDCQMPIMDGFEATQRIRNGEAGEQSQRLPIIAMTAHALAKDKERSLAAGMDDYLSKPVQVNALYRAISHWHGRYHGEKQVVQKSSQSKPSPEIKAFDPDDLLGRLDNDHDLAKVTISIFLEGVAEVIAELRLAFDAQNPEAIVMQAHGLKGAALNASAGAVAEIARQIEFLARDGVLEGAEVLVDALLPGLTSYKEELQRTGWL